MTHFKKAICNDAFENWEIADVFKYISDLGYDGVEINPYTLCETAVKLRFTSKLDGFSLADSERVRDAAETAGVEIIGIHSILKSPKGFFHINHPDASIRAATLEHLNALITFCGDLGGKIIPFGASKQRTVLEELTHQQAWDYAVEIFKEALKTAEERGVTLCLEPLTHRLTNFITKASEAVKMVEDINHPNFKMMIDVRSASDDELPIPELIRRSAEHLAHFHANDDNGRAPGKGNADYTGISDALKEIDYEGYLSVEVFDFRPDPKTIAVESLNALRKYFD